MLSLGRIYTVLERSKDGHMIRIDEQHGMWARARFQYIGSPTMVDFLYDTYFNPPKRKET